MNVNTRNRTELKSYFIKNSIPTESNFAELIDGMLNQKDDGIVKLPGDPLNIEAGGEDTSEKRAINFYRNFGDGDSNPDWILNLNPRSDPDDSNTAHPGFNISDGESNSRLFIDRTTGNVGIGTTSPVARLDVMSANRTGSHPSSVNGLYVTGDLSPANGVEFRRNNATEGIGFGYNTIYATGSTTNQDLNLVARGTGRVNITQENWHTIAANEFISGWTNYHSAYNPAGYFKDSLGIVHLRGMVKSGAIGGLTTIFVLPQGYRPAYYELHVNCTNPNVSGRVTIATDGRVIPDTGNPVWFSLDGITFRAA